MERISIIGINGSPRKDGDTARMLREVLISAEKHGAKTKVVHLADFKMEPYHGIYDKKPDKETLRLFGEIIKADGIVLATPVHWLSSSSLMKIFIDNLTHLEVTGFKLEGKVAGVVAHCWEDGGFAAARDIIGILNTMGAVIPPYAINARNKYIKKNKETGWMWKDAKLLGKNMAVACELIKRLRPNWDYE